MVNVRNILALALLALGLLLTSEPASGKKSPPITIQGTIYAVDPSGSTVTLKDGAGTLTTLDVTRKSKLRRNNKKVALSGLVLGDQATAQYDALNDIKQLNSAGLPVTTLQGNVIGVNSGSGDVQLTNGSFGTNAQTRIVRNGKITSLGSLTSQDHVTAHVTNGNALLHHSETGQGEEEGDHTAVDIHVEGPEEAEIKGTISAIDLLAKTVTITPFEGGADVTVNVTANTIIKIEDEHGDYEYEYDGGGEGGGEGDGGEADDAGTIEDLIVGLAVEVVYDPATFDAFKIEVENEEEEGYAEGPITAIDLVAGTVTIDCYGTPVTLFVDASTKIKRNGETAVFADLQIGDEAMAEYNLVTMIAKEIEVYVEGEGDDDGEGEGEGEGGVS